jgi:diaminopimelate decarboxylase
MHTRLTLESIRKTLRTAMSRGLLADHDAVIFYDFDGLGRRLGLLQGLFPPSTLHAVAAKANPLLAVARRLRNLGAGMEVASLAELRLAEAAGFPPARIVFDSPVKTTGELTYALTQGVQVNVDSLDELTRVACIGHDVPSTSTIGVRINPQVGTGRIAMTSVAGHFSKFGIPLLEQGPLLKEAFLRYPWLCGVHVHVGSQGCPLELLVQGVSRVWEFVREVRASGGNVTTVDIGGGLPARYRAEEMPPDLETYVTALRRVCPGMFQNPFRLITEFGRALHSPAGWAISRVEYVKHSRYGNVAMIHLGADMFLRKCYAPDVWHHDIAVLDARGECKQEPGRRYAVAGPLCFSGDILERDIELPGLVEGDLLVIRDVGAYTFSMWSRYNSRQFPRVLGYENGGERIEILKERERAEDVVEFWQ